MNKGRRIGAVVAATVAAVGMSSVGMVSPAAANERGPRPINTWLHGVRANTPTWVNVLWRTDRRVCDAEVRFSGARVEIDYPGRRNFTSFSRGDSLRPGRLDYTAVRVTPYSNRSGVALLRATITYDNCGPHAYTRQSTSVVALPVVRNGWNNGHDGGWNNGHDGGWNNGHGNGGWNNGHDRHGWNNGHDRHGWNNGHDRHGWNNGHDQHGRGGHDQHGRGDDQHGRGGDDQHGRGDDQHGRGGDDQHGRGGHEQHGTQAALA